MNESVTTLKEIAAAAGCSPRAVAAVLNPSDGNVRVGERTQLRVLETARQLGYRRNELARAMATGQSRVIGLLTSVGSSDSVAGMMEGALDEAAARGYVTKILRSPYRATPAQIHEVVQLCTTWRLDGAIAISLREEVLSGLRREIEDNHRPVAYLETFPAGRETIRVASDDAGGMRAALTHLVRLGHGRIAFLGGPADSSISQSRARLFRSTLQDLGVPAQAGLMVDSDWGNAEIIEDAARQLLGATPRPTAILSVSDAGAMVTMRLAWQLGLALPEQLSVVGYGNAILSAYAYPSLTTIAQPFSGMGRIAVQRLLAHIEAGRKGSSGAVTSSYDAPPQDLIVRASTAPPEESALR